MPAQTMTPPPQRVPNLWKNVALLLVSTLLACAAIEAGFRLLEKPLGIEIIGRDFDLLRSAFPASYDAELGWVPREGARGRQNVWGTEITIGKHGIRENGPGGPVRPRPLTLMVGDSFAFGDEVSDHETVPAHLERLAGTRVLNGGVFGYGIDQTYLRALRLLQTYRPDVLVFSMITADVSRTQLNIRTGAGKPYFAVSGDGSGMDLRNVPVPRTSRGGLALRRVIAASHAASYVVMRLFPEYWMTGMSAGSHQVHSDGPLILRLILRSLNALAAERSMTVVLLIQDYPLPGIEDAYVRAAVGTIVDMVKEEKLDRLAVVNMYPVLLDIKLRDPAQFAGLLGPRGGHASSEGNALVAAELLPLVGRPSRR